MGTLKRGIEKKGSGLFANNYISVRLLKGGGLDRKKES